MCERAVLTNRPSLDLSPFVLEGRKSLPGSVGQVRCLPQPEQLQGLRARTEQGRELDDGTKRSRCRRYRRRQGQGGCLHSLAVVRANVPKHTTGATSADAVASPAQGSREGDGGQRRLRAG